MICVDCSSPLFPPSFHPPSQIVPSPSSPEVEEGMLPPRLLVAFLKGEKKGPFRQRNAFGKEREDIFFDDGTIFHPLPPLAPLLIYKQFASPFSLLLLQPRRPGQEKGIRSRRKESKSNRVADDETRDADDAPNAVGNDGQKERVKGRKERVKEGGERERVSVCASKKELRSSP